MNTIFNDAYDFVSNAELIDQNEGVAAYATYDQLTDIVLEEVIELRDATTDKDKLDAFIDIIYAAATGALLAGFTEEELTRAWMEIHRSNMTKTIAPVIENGKLQKGAYYTAPNLDPILFN
jgi:hypothetical protein